MTYRVPNDVMRARETAKFRCASCGNTFSLRRHSRRRTLSLPHLAIVGVAIVGLSLGFSYLTAEKKSENRYARLEAPPASEGITFSVKVVPPANKEPEALPHGPMLGPEPRPVPSTQSPEVSSHKPSNTEGADAVHLKKSPEETRSGETPDSSRSQQTAKDSSAKQRVASPSDTIEATPATRTENVSESASKNRELFQFKGKDLKIELSEAGTTDRKGASFRLSGVSGSDISYTSLTLQNPPRVVIDVFGSETKARRFKGVEKNSFVQRIRSGVHNNRYRIVVDLHSGILPDISKAQEANVLQVALSQENHSIVNSGVE
jgi:hypothetical protein